jgi:hypothetical protein
MLDGDVVILHDWLVEFWVIFRKRTLMKVVCYASQPSC